MSPFCILLTEVFINFRALNPCVYLTPGIYLYMIPVFIWMNMIHAHVDIVIVLLAIICVCGYLHT